MQGLALIIRKCTAIYQQNVQEGPSAVLLSAIRFLYNLIIQRDEGKGKALLSQSNIFDDILRILMLDRDEAEVEHITLSMKILREATREDKLMI